MNKNKYDEMNDELCPEYDLSQLKGGIRGKYARSHKKGTNLVLLAPDVAEVFKDNESLNEALRLLIKITGGKRTKPVQPIAPSNSHHSTPLHGESH